LVLPTDDLVGIAVEGLSPSEQTLASAETVDVADLVLYYGKHPTFETARIVAILQFKYSIRSKSVPLRVSDAKETIQKFAAAFRDYQKRFGKSAVEKKLVFEVITNRPISTTFEKAIQGLALGHRLKGDARTQAQQFISACQLVGNELAAFARKITIVGFASNLRESKHELSRLLADWSPAPDALARARLGAIRQPKGRQQRPYPHRK